MSAAEGVTDHVVDLFFAAGAHTTLALNAGIQSNFNTGVREIFDRLLARGKT